MNTRISIALLCLLSCTLAGCPRGDKPSTADDSQGGTQTPGPMPGGDNPAGGISDVQVAAQPDTASPPATSCTATHGKQPKVTSGTYCVCNEGSHEQHDQRNAKHLAQNQTVVINSLDWVTDVQLGANTIQMVRSEDEVDLTALVSYDHTHGAATEKVTHLVRITPETNPTNLADTACDPGSKNVLRISFCYKEGASWSCGPRPGSHNGDTHVQN